MTDFLRKKTESKQGLEALSFGTSPLTTVDAYVDLAVVDDVLGFQNKTIILKNTGGANGVHVKVSGSLDEGTTYPVVLLAETALAFGAVQEVNESAKVLTNIKVEAKSQVAGNPTTVVADIGLCS